MKPLVHSSDVVVPGAAAATAPDLTGERLWLGERSGGLAPQRPGALSPLAVVRR